MAKVTWIGVTEAAKRLRLSRAWIRRLCQQGRLDARKPLGADGMEMPWLISVVTLGEYRKNRRRNPPKRGRPAA